MDTKILVLTKDGLFAIDGADENFAYLTQLALEIGEDDAGNEEIGLAPFDNNYSTIPLDELDAALISQLWPEEMEDGAEQSSAYPSNLGLVIDDVAPFDSNSLTEPNTALNAQQGQSPPAPEDDSADHCTWFCHAGDNCWHTSCNQYFQLEHDTPSSNNMVFCCFCGKPIEEESEEEDGADIQDALERFWNQIETLVEDSADV